MTLIALPAFVGQAQRDDHHHRYGGAQVSRGRVTFANFSRWLTRTGPRSKAVTPRDGRRTGDVGARRHCRAHEVDNLFAVDGSPFATGTGANPTLTIMANAWRVAEHIVETGNATTARPGAVVGGRRGRRPGWSRPPPGDR